MTSRRFLSCAAFPATMAAAYGTHFMLNAAGLPAPVSAYLAAALAAAIVTVLEYAIPYDRAWLQLIRNQQVSGSSPLAGFRRK